MPIRKVVLSHQNDLVEIKPYIDQLKANMGLRELYIDNINLLLSNYCQNRRAELENIDSTLFLRRILRQVRILIFYFEVTEWKELHEIRKSIEAELPQN